MTVVGFEDSWDNSLEGRLLLQACAIRIYFCRNLALDDDSKHYFNLCTTSRETRMDYKQFFRATVDFERGRYFESQCTWCGATYHAKMELDLNQWEAIHDCPAAHCASLQAA